MKLNERCVAEYSTSSAPIDKEGYLNKKGELNRGYQRRWFLLKGNLLYYFEKRSDKEPIGVIVLDNCHVELAESGEPYAFQISFGGDGSRTYILGADTAKDMEAWMRAITHSNYDCLKMMVESFESKLQKLTSEEIDLATASCSNSKANPTSIESVSGASDLVGINSKKDNLDSFEAVMARPISEGAANGDIKNSDGVDFDNLLPQKSKEVVSAYNTHITVTNTEPAVGNLISLGDDDDEDQIPIQNEFSLNDSFYSNSADIMPLSYSDLGQLEDMHTEHLLNKLSRNVSKESKDDSYLTTRLKRDPVPRNLRPKSERRRNNINIRTSYGNVEPSRFDRSKSKTLPRPLSDVDTSGYHSEHGSIFKHLHELYSASIWVKCKEYGKQASQTTLK